MTPGRLLEDTAEDSVRRMRPECPPVHTLAEVSLGREAVARSMSEAISLTVGLLLSCLTAVVGARAAQVFAREGPCGLLGISFTLGADPV